MSFNRNSFAIILKKNANRIILLSLIISVYYYRETDNDPARITTLDGVKIIGSAKGGAKYFHEPFILYDNCF